LSKFLNPFLNAIVELQAEKTATSSLVYGKLKRLLFNCSKVKNDSIVFNAAQLVKDDMEIRFKKFIDYSCKDFNPHFILCALLDPCTAYDIVDVPQDILQRILSEVLKQHETQVGESSTEIPHLDSMGEDDSFERHQEELRKSRMSAEPSTFEHPLSKSYINFVQRARGPKAKDYWPMTGKDDYVSLIFKFITNFLASNLLPCSEILGMSSNFCTD